MKCTICGECGENLYELRFLAFNALNAVTKKIDAKNRKSYKFTAKNYNKFFAPSFRKIRGF